MLFGKESLRNALEARGESTMGRVPSAAGADARQRDAGDASTLSRIANAANAPAPLEPKGRMGIGRRSLPYSSSARAFCLANIQLFQNQKRGQWNEGF